MKEAEVVEQKARAFVLDAATGALVDVELRAVHGVDGLPFAPHDRAQLRQNLTSPPASRDWTPAQSGGPRDLAFNPTNATKLQKHIKCTGP